MIKRVIEAIFKLEPEQCQTCKIYFLQLEHERNINKELVETITSLLKPAPVIEPVAPSGTKVQIQHSKIWGRRRQELEEDDRKRARLIKDSPLVAKPDEVKSTVKISGQTVEELEKELGVVDAESTASQGG